MLKEYARNNRKNPTPAEKRLWHFVRGRQLNGYRFVREKIIGNYIVDFVCRAKKTVIELDGGQHAEVDGINHDRERDVFLREKGYKVIRIWNNEVFENITGVVDLILKTIESVP